MRGQGRPRGAPKRLSALFPATPAAPGTAARTPFVLLIVVLLGSGLITLLLLNSALNQGSFELSRLEKKTDELTDEQQALQQEVDGYSAPGALERRARRLGMVPGGAPAFLLPDGTVRGKPGVAGADGAPLSSSAEPSAAALLRATTAGGPAAPRVPATPPVVAPSVAPPVPAGSGTLGPQSTPAAGAAPGHPAPAPAASPVSAPARVPASTARSSGSAPAPAPTTPGR
ncbi:septum formation initiator family protein [Streptomyces bugieae]|uniref:Septum formation initiator family protein n=1 Tax=Streptomyces bugieae TaxID=3098223 RepID=A0ABU7NYR7_9ACTN|nr:septum formation initiator family protein [Streptomyces sp. DSM 41528]